MKGDPEERAVQIGRYIAGAKRRYRAGGSAGVRREQKYRVEGPVPACTAPGPRPLGRRYSAVLLNNKAQRHLRGGEATRLQIPARTAQPCGLGVAPQPAQRYNRSKK